jgi:AraC-like DNA-binding protein
MAAWVFFFPVSYGPLLYLYCRNVILDRPLQIRDWVHALPILFCYLFNLDTLLFDSEGIRTWIVRTEAPTWRIWLSEYVLYFFALIYTVAAAMVIWRYHHRARNTISNYNPAVFKWLWTLVLATITVWAVKGVTSFTSIVSNGVVVLSDALIVILIYLIALAQWRNPKLFTIEQLSEPEHLVEAGRAKLSSPSEGVLDDEVRANLFESVRSIVEEQALYRNSELTLTKLAEATGLGTHHLSEVLNQHAGQNFNQFINAYRVEEVCQALDQEETGSVLDLAIDAGFSSKSTFNTIFKKMTGVTPTQYRKRRAALRGSEL